MCCELLDCGNVSSSFRDRRWFSATSLDEQTNAAPYKRPAYGRGSGIKDPCEKGGISTGTTAGKGNVRFTGFSILLGTQGALTHCYWFYWECTTPLLQPFEYRNIICLSPVNDAKAKLTQMVADNNVGIRLLAI